MPTAKPNLTDPSRTVTTTLFLCLFAGQAALIAMSPVLAKAASDLHVSAAAAGQLRTISGLAAGSTALALGALGRRVGLGRQLFLASGLLALASIASAAACDFWLGVIGIAHDGPTRRAAVRIRRPGAAKAY